MLLIEYVNEHLAAGAVGRAAVIIGFLAALVATYAGFKATRNLKTQAVSAEVQSWSSLTGGAFGLMSLSIVTVIILLLTMMTQQWYEYQYVQQHVNDELAFKYVFTAFWEGQEGSFLLWMFWHSVLGLFVWFSDKEWRLPVITVIASVQVILLSMLLGIYIPGEEAAKIGSSPFLLLREAMDIPLFAQSDYVSLIEGTGLNPLLQNYWMLIHPPTLFLGFASTVVPFAFAIAGLWLGRHRTWLNPALRWSLFSAGILGIGILMGGAWAYEALNFGGYWAWDPVENTSLVPWILLIAGIHTTLVARSTGHSIASSYLFFILSFVGILYSSLLTRSGLLGETSVHAFTEMGLENQLFLLVGFFSVLGFGLVAYRWKSIPRKQEEEKTSSREFWMFLGSLVLLFSAGMITASTSLPVINKLGDYLNLDWGHLTISEPVSHYNKYQLWVGVFMSLFTGVAHYMRWRSSAANWKKLATRMSIAFAVSLGLAALTYSSLMVRGYHFFVLAFGAYFALFSNLDYVVSSKIALWQRLGGFAAHGGFAIMIIGVLFSGLNQHQISKNVFAMEGLLGEEQIGKNVLLIKDLPMVINGYEVTYMADTLIGNQRDYTIRYRELSREGVIGNEFTLTPYALYTNDFAKIASMNPDTKHYWDHDVFTHVTGLPPGSQSAEQAKIFEDSLNFQPFALAIGDSTHTSKHAITLLEVIDNPSHPEYKPEAGDLALGVKLKIERLDFDTTEYATPVVVLRENLVYSYPDQVNSFDIRAQLPETAIASRYATESELSYQTVSLEPGENFKLNGYDFTFERFDPNASHPAFTKQEGDVAVNAVLKISDRTGNAIKEMRPLYYIRGNAPADLKAFDQENGLHARLTRIDPSTNQAELQLAVADQVEGSKIPLEIAENASRNDWLVLEATVFPGINLFWAGSILMLLGLLISMGFRISERKSAPRLSPKPVTSGIDNMTKPVIEETLA